MAFVFVLLLSLGSFLKIEVSTGLVQKNQSQARGYALLGLYTALGELQAAAGPDQRVTATADILGGTREENSHWTGVWNVEGDNPFDYGVGPREAFTGKLDTSAVEPVWLISSNLAPDPSVSIESLNMVDGRAQTVTIVSSNTAVAADGSPDADVVAGRITVESGEETEGGYAWWVGDQGVKAKVNTVDASRDMVSPNAETGRQRDRLPVVVSQRIAGELMNDADDDFPVNVEALASVQTGSDMSIASGGSLGLDWIRQSYHDVSYASAGVLSDTRNGGLKKDLSRGLGDQWQDFLHLLEPDSGEWVNGWPRPQPVFQIPGPAGQFPAPFDDNFYGPYWDVLYHYANLYQPHEPWLPNVDRINLNNHTFEGYMDGGSGPGGLDDLYSGNGTLEPRGMGPDSQVYLPRHDFANSSWSRGNWFALPPSIDSSNQYLIGNTGRRDPLWNTVAPVMARLQLVFSLSSEVDTTVTGLGTDEVAYRLFLHITPAVVLWNPYNVTLEARRYSFDFEPIVHMQIKVDGTDYLTGPANGQYNLMDLLKANGWGPDSTTDHSGNYFGNIHSNEDNQAMLLETQSVAFGPGEVKVFSLPSQNIPWHPLMTRGSSNSNYWLTNSFNLTHSAYVKLIQSSANGEFVDSNKDRNSFNSLPPIIVNTEADDPGGYIEVEFFAESVGNQYGNNGYLTVDGIDFNTAPNSFGGNTAIRIGGGLRYARFVTSYMPFSLGYVTNLEGNPVAFAAIYARLKTTQEAADGVPLFSQFNVRNLVANKLIGNPDMPFPEMMEGGLLDASVSMPDIQESGGLSYYGPSYTPEGGGQHRLILFDVPRQPLLSMGELMHANISYYDVLPQYAIGNSYPSPYIGLRDYYALWEQDNGYDFPIVDYSYALNYTLFDDYFFSGVPARYDRYNSASLRALEDELPPYESFDEDYLTEGKPLPNSRMRFFDAGYSMPEAFNRLQDLETASSHLLVDGAFNVNSTSVEAWKSVLGGLAIAPGESYPLARYSGANSSLSSGALGYPQSRFSLPVDEPGARWTGFASLDEGEIETLAEHIVDEVRARGPFLSMGDFVNRRLSNDDSGEAGALQAAIDASDINSTAALGSSYNVTTDSSSPYARMDANHLAPAQGAGVPGWILQNDILRGLAPVLSVRSDTFVIRSYGDVVNPLTGEVKASAWLEAVVQRLPEFVDTTNAPETPVTLFEPGEQVREDNPGLSATNRRFGRRFVIVSFRWLSPDEV